MKLMRVTEPERVLSLIEERFHPLEAEPVPLEEAGGRILAETVTPGEDVPGFNRSTVDGYAVSARETFGAGEGLPAVLECAGEVLMGHPAPAALQPGQCFLVHTGAVLPEGADAVVMMEDTEVSGSMVNCYRQVAPGENVIHRGEDLRRDEPALEEGRLLRAPELGLLASLGIATVPVYRQPVVGLLSTGDELVDYKTAPGKLPPGRIRDSNSVALAYLCRQSGARAVRGGILGDSFAEFIEKSRALMEQVDFLVFSGGSSVGSRDFTARTMQELGEPGLLVEGVSIQPGKPTLLADCNGKPVLGLPGHPVSALIIFSLFGSAIIGRLAGRKAPPFKPAVRATLTRNIPSRSGRTDYVRVQLKLEGGGFSASPVFGRSGMLRTLAEANGIIVVPAAKEGLAAGEAVEVYLWE
ncbi:MAG TPA: molybdopterin molybdotransferase MoeA [Bacillota bacterium]|nr:molybdopterin molybdotransferase MoeA [Bacillota bacterium]